MPAVRTDCRRVGGSIQTLQRLSAAFSLLCCTMVVFPAAVAEGQALPGTTTGSQPAGLVNVFLGTSGDHGQLSPAASYPFSMLSIGPQTYPHLHAGYEYNARTYLGFTHTRFEGVGCQGSGGNILVKPFLGDVPEKDELIRTSQYASPGYFSAAFTNGIRAEMTVYGRSGQHRYQFPRGAKGFYIDLSHTLANRFVAEEHRTEGASVSGWIEAGTTCNAGKYRVYYFMEFDKEATIEAAGNHRLLVRLPSQAINAGIRIALSSVSTEYARAAVKTDGFDEFRDRSQAEWNRLLGMVRVKGDPEREKLFYSLLYRTMQSPYVISEPDGRFRATDGTLQTARDTMYNGWAIWDNYRTQLPLLSLLLPAKHQGMVTSIANLYRAGKKDYATQTEPSNTVRTEHAAVVLLDAYRKGYKVDFKGILDSLIIETDRLDFSRPDKALESSYDVWALAEVLKILKKNDLSKKYQAKALEYKNYWNKDFRDIRRSDVDRMQARGLYQGTIWQYRWFVPFDLKGLKELIGGDQAYISQLDEFFHNDYYNHANEPDIQVPLMYNASSQPWKSQDLMHRYAVDTVVQYYFNDNSRGIDPFVDVIYKNQPKAFIRTMDDDAGAMSAWFVFAACGFSPACVGWPVYYLNVPLFESIELKRPGGRSLNIHVENFAPQNRYIKKVIFNGKEINRNYVTHQEMMAGGTMTVVASDTPDSRWGIEDQWISDAG